MRNRTITALTMSMLLAATGVQGQSWDAPSFMGPRPGSDLGIYLVDPQIGDLGIQGIWRTDGSSHLGLRLGFVDAGDGVIQLGAETWGTIQRADAEFPLDVSWTAGAGASVDGVTTVSVPAGVSIGRTLVVGSIAVQLYAHPRLALVAFKNPAGDVDLDLDGQFDLGADMFLSSSSTLKVGVSLGDADALGIGLAWRQ